MTDLRTELHEDEQLSTADMAAAGERPVPGQEVRRDAAGPEAAGVGSDTAPRAAAPEATPLFREEETQALRSRWDAIQTAFVDNPRQAVEQADNLVAQAIKSLAETFAQERDQLEQQWSRGADVSTEDLRIALQRYRSFFTRLLSLQ